MAIQVLIADPDQTARETLATNLSSWGYQTTTVSNGTDAWNTLRKPDAPKIVILDSMLRGVEALELCRLIRDTRGDKSLVLVLDAQTDRAARIDALESGADDVIGKPLHLRELRMRLSAGMRGRRLDVSEMPPATAAAKDPADRALVGRVIAGKYRVERLIGKGGMGTVWQGSHLALGTKIAIKFIKGDYAKNDLARARFALEARSAARVQTRYAVKVFDHGVTEGGMPYIVMEYLEGRSLMGVACTSGPLPFADTVTLVTEIAHALEQVHSFGMIHRDVKPDNILLVEDPDAPAERRRTIAKLIDFGVAKVLATSRPQTGQYALSTQQGIVVGTPNYMPPEIINGDADHSVGSDLWALAACAFTAITGRIPFEGATFPDVVKRVCRSPLPVPSELEPSVPPEFDAWFARACSRDQTKRFRSAREMAQSLAQAYADHADGLLEMTPSLKSFVTDAPPSALSTRDLISATMRPTVRPAQVQIFEIDTVALTVG